MRISLCLNASGISDQAFVPLSDGGDAFSRSLDRLRRLSAPEGFELSEPTVIADREIAFPESLPAATVVRPEDSSLGAFLEALELLSEGSDCILLVPADAPLWDPGLAARLLEVHKKYVAEYTFADGYPEGLAPEVVSRHILAPLLELARRYPEVSDRHTLFEILQKDINAFDVETELSSTDMRMLRIRLRCDTKRNRLLCENLLRSGPAPGARDAEALSQFLHEHQEHLRTLPAYLSVQVVSESPQKPFYLPEYPFQSERREMAAEDFENLVLRFSQFAPESVVHISTWGEVSLHSDAESLLEVSNRIEVDRFLVETSGLGWSEGILKKIVDGHYPKITWIVALDAYSEEVYRMVRGEGYREAVTFATTLLGRFPESVYVQSTRINENEADLEAFYREWKKVTPNVIIQKYDHFSGSLPDRRVVDNAPVVRLPCWHLKRDLTVLVDGSVPLCREDLSIEHSRGNAFSETIQEVWDRGEAYYRQHLVSDYPAICQSCDEYYTFNF